MKGEGSAVEKVERRQCRALPVTLSVFRSFDLMARPQTASPSPLSDHCTFDKFRGTTKAGDVDDFCFFKNIDLSVTFCFVSFFNRFVVFAGDRSIIDFP